MDVMFTHCAGLDGQKKTVMACRVTPDPAGQQADGMMELQAFGTMTRDPLAWSDWLAEVGVTHVTMESTGEYWRPSYNLLEGTFTVLLVNAAHVKQVPGRKPDKADARRLATLIRYGLLAARVIPPQGQRDLRDLTRDRTKLVQERSREGNRVQGVLERAHSQLAAVATDIMGVSGRAILAAWVTGRADPATMAELAQGRRRTKLPLWEQALTGLRRDHHRRLLTLPLAHLDVLDEPIDALSVEIMCSLTELEPSGAVTPPSARAEAVGEATDTVAPQDADSPLSFAQAVTVLETLPGVDQRGAELLVAEWGTALSRVGTASRLSAWTGVAPGNDESAGKRRSGKTRRGNRTLRTGLSVGLVSAPGYTSGENTGDHGRRPCTRRQCLSPALPP